MLRDTEWTLLTELARDHLLAPIEAREALAPYFAAEFVAGLSLGASSARNAEVLVHAVRDAGMLGDDPPVLRLLTALAHHPTIVPLPDARIVARMLERAQTLLLVQRQDAPAANDPFMATMLGGRNVFIDRRELRVKLRRLHDDTEPTVILQITGDRQSGTSHSYLLIEHAAGIYGFRKVPVLLSESSTPEEVVGRIADWVASDKPVPERQDDPRKWYGQVANWLVRNAWESRRSWWFVLDEINHLPPTSEIWDLVGELAIAVGYFGDNRVRLVLLGYDRGIDRKLRNRSESEHLRPLSETDLREFIAEQFADRYSRLPVEERAARVEDTVAAILAAAVAEKTPGRCYMEKLGVAVERQLAQPASPSRRRSMSLPPIGRTLPEEVTPKRWAFREAAALLVAFDPAELDPRAAGAAKGDALLELMYDCDTAGDPTRRRWTLKDDVRSAALHRLAGREAALRALETNGDLEREPVEAMAREYLRGTAPPLDRQDRETLRHTQRALDWLADVPGLEGIPSVDEAKHASSSSASARTTARSAAR
jgi:hypothetical protein